MDEHSHDMVHEQAQENGYGTVRRRLGRGLNALLGGRDDELQHDSGSDVPHPDPSHIHVELIERNPFQPRKEFDPESLGELVESIKQHGVLQPLLVRPHAGHYQLIAGERRWLAAKQAGIDNVPCRVLDLDDQHVFEVAIEENLKRKDLNVLEKAQAFQDYLNRFGSTIEQLAKQLSMNRSTVSNFLRLLDLTERVKESLASDKITNGHARALLSLSEADQIALCERIEKESLSVRLTEQAVRDILEGERPQTIPFPASAEPSEKPEVTNHVRSLEAQLRDHFGTRVEIRVGKNNSGRIIIHFGASDEFERIVRDIRRAA